MIFDDFGIDFPASPVPSLGQKLDSIPPCFSSQSLAQTQLPSQEKNRVGGMRRQPLKFQYFGRYPSKWFLAITCTIWLRLEFRDRGSAWFFSAHLLFFHAQGQIFEPRIGFWDPGSTFWPGDLFGVKKWSRKK